MGKPTGFMEYTRHTNPERAIDKRIKDYFEFHSSLDEQERKTQAARCMDCGVPYCQSAMEIKHRVVGCPLHNLIPEWNDEIYHGHLNHALSRLLKTNNFPEFTSRVCPALCEKACLCGVNDSPVTIHDNENFIIESAFKNALMTPRIPVVRSNKKVAVIGSGPSGLAVADSLNHRGHHVDVYERDDRIGGLLMYGIPNMKLDKSVIERRLKLMEAEGVVFKTGVNVGKDITKEELLKEYDAVVLCVGSKQARTLPNVKVAKNVMFAVDYLAHSTKNVLANKADNQAKGKHVVIVGGGDTGNDCVATAIRQQAKSVVQLEMMGEPPLERTADNPWPEWPNVKKTDYGQQEAIHVFGHDPRIYNTTVKEVIEEKGVMKKIKTVQVKFENGKLTEVAGSEKVIDCDLLIIAAGFTGAESYVTKAFKLKTTPRNTILTNEAYQCGDTPLFAAGDGRRGQSLVVWAIAEGRNCAAHVDRYLMGYTTME